MNITLFGGSFNPPHLGHQIVLDQAFQLIPKLDQIWLLPDYQHSFSKNKFFIPVSHRLKLAKLLTSEKIKLQTCVIDHKMSGQTIDHIRYLQTTYPQHQFSFLLGFLDKAQKAGKNRIIIYPHCLLYGLLSNSMHTYTYPIKLRIDQFILHPIIKQNPIG